MIEGELASLRPVREEDLEEVHRKTLEREARGPWCPLPRTSLATLVQAFHENGLWSEEPGSFASRHERWRVEEPDRFSDMAGSVDRKASAWRKHGTSSWGLRRTMRRCPESPRIALWVR
jgi:hypothetical protein